MTDRSNEQVGPRGAIKDPDGWRVMRGPHRPGRGGAECGENGEQGGGWWHR
ncbi:hypothetical protein [Micromonospora sp. ALFpr18c]|uniref:hypothetical protein n=1 Tax=unclassified Micromonospora TaxID=2617518 RepID=UPI001788D770|nr:hypothetical protein [Micromonospora sp. ALFpr18c]